MKQIYIWSLLFLSLFFANCQDNTIVEFPQPTSTHPLDNMNGSLEPRVSTIGTATGMCDYNSTPQDLNNEWSLLWSDEFETWNPANWTVWNSGAYNNEMQMYRPQNIAVANSNLVITMKKERATGPVTPTNNSLSRFNFTSGRIESVRSFTPTADYPKRRLRMAARIKVAKGDGLWPAFWSYGRGTPYYGEIDIFEHRGSDAYRYESAYHYSLNGVDLVTSSNHVITTGSNLTTCYHVYEVVWTSDRLDMYFDGNLVKSYSGITYPYLEEMAGKPQNLVLNLAVGGNFFPQLNVKKIPNSAQVFVDWVRVYQEL